MSARPAPSRIRRPARASHLCRGSTPRAPSKRPDLAILWPRCRRHRRAARPGHRRRCLPKLQRPRPGTSTWWEIAGPASRGGSHRVLAPRRTRRQSSSPVSSRLRRRCVPPSQRRARRQILHELARRARHRVHPRASRTFHCPRSTRRTRRRYPVRVASPGSGCTPPRD
jgi:hypothetical protein